MKKALPWLLAILAIAMMAIQWLELNKLKVALKESDSLLVAKMHTFDESLGRAETLADVNGSILKELRNEIPEDIRKDLEKFKAELQSMAAATVRHKSQGSGTVTRSHPRSRAKPTDLFSGLETESLYSGGPAGLQFRSEV
jgi:uncharacterized membrane protein YhiD involved in acid resistance